MKNAFKVLNQADKTIILNPQKPLISLIWLHGLGDTSAGFLDYFEMSQSPVHKGCRVKLLHAPNTPVTINGGMKMPSWYDIKMLNFEGSKEDQDKRCSLKDVKSSMAILDKKVEEEAEYWKNQKVEGDVYKRIFVGGFSQGCAIALLYGLTCKNILGGIIGFSGYLFQSFDIPNLGKLPILLNHGRHDQMIPFKVSYQSYKRLLQDPSVTFKQQNVEHSVSVAQADQMTKWLMDKIQKSSL